MVYPHGDKKMMGNASKNGGCWLMNEQSMGNRSEIPRSLTRVRHDVCSSNWPAACGSAGVAPLHHDSLNWSHPGSSHDMFMVIQE